jgi:hypothetical protein
MPVLTQPIGAVIEGVAGGTAVTVTGDIDATPVPGSYLGQQVISGNDGSQNATIPAGTTTIWISARGGPVYASVNAAGAAASSGFYIPEDMVRIVGPFTAASITSLGVWAATGDLAHLVYES